MIRFLQTPGPVKKIVLSGILLVFCAAMVITLVPGGLGFDVGLGGPGQGVVVQVDGEDLSTAEVQRAIEQYMRRAGPQAAALRGYFAPRILDEMINDKVTLAEAHRLGLGATDDEVRDEIQHGQLAIYFYPEGKFIGQQQYESFLNQNDLTPQRFEAQLKDQITVNKLRHLVAGGATVSDLEIMREFDQKNTKVKFDYAVLTREDVLKTIHPSEAELKAFYDQNKARYVNSIPEKRKVRYVLFDSAKLEAQTQISRDELQAYYNQHREEYRVPEQVKVRHILIKTPAPGPDGKPDAKGVEEARKKAEDILKQLKGGAKFEDLAKKYSEDPGSAKNGGSLDWIGRGRTVAEFEKAAFSLAKGATSDLVQSTFGFHIIRVDDKQDAHLKTLDDVKSQIEPLLKQQKAVQAATTAANALVSAARKDGLEKAAAAKGVQVVSTDFFSHSDSLPGIGSASQFMEAVFSAPEKAPADQVQISQGIAVYELAGVKPASTPTFDEIRSRVENDFKNERAGVVLAQKTQELSDRAKAAHDLKKAAKELGASLKTSDLVGQDSQVPDIGSMSGQAAVAFTMKPGEISGPVQAGANGAVLALVDRQQPSAADFAAKKDEVRDSLLQAKQNQMFAVFLSDLRERRQKAGKIKINKDEMTKITGSQSGGEGD